MSFVIYYKIIFIRTDKYFLIHVDGLFKFMFLTKIKNIEKAFE